MWRRICCLAHSGDDFHVRVSPAASQITDLARILTPSSSIYYLHQVMLYRFKTKRDVVTEADVYSDSDFSCSATKENQNARSDAGTFRVLRSAGTTVDFQQILRGTGGKETTHSQALQLQTEVDVHMLQFQIKTGATGRNPC